MRTDTIVEGAEPVVDEVLPEVDLQAEMEKNTPPKLIYNAGDEFVEAEYGGVAYQLAPDSTGGVKAFNRKTDRFEAHDGITEIRDHWGQVYEKDPNHGGKQVSTGARKLFHTAIGVVKHLEKNYGMRGVIHLTGHKAQDDRRKEVARNAWKTFKLAMVQSIIDNWEMRLRVFRANPANEGQLPEPMKPFEAAAYDWIAQYRMGRTGRKDFVCPIHGYDTDSAEKWDLHQKALHPKDEPKTKKKPEKEAAA